MHKVILVAQQIGSRHAIKKLECIQHDMKPMETCVVRAVGDRIYFRDPMNPRRDGTDVASVLSL